MSFRAERERTQGAGVGGGGHMAVVGKLSVSRVRKRKGYTGGEERQSDDTDVTPTIGRWVTACFPQESLSSERDVRDLVEELG